MRLTSSGIDHRVHQFVANQEEQAFLAAFLQAVQRAVFVRK
jgi:hypothetical protein